MDLIEVELAKLDQHPNNPRRDPGNVDELAASIKAQGLLEPIVIAPGEKAGRYVLIAGHRRVKAGKQIKRKTLPALVRSDLATPEDQLPVMLIENLHRADLTPVEEAEGYAQLKLFGLKPADIAGKVGRPKTTVDRRLALMKLPEAAREKLHTRQITLDTAQKLVEFASEPETMARLETYAGTHNFDWAVTEERRRRARARERAKILKQLKDGGVTIIDQPARWHYGDSPIKEVVEVIGAVDFDDLDEAEQNAAEDKVIAEHASCPHHAAFLPEYGSTPVFVCQQPDSHEGWAERAAADEPRGRGLSPEEAAAKEKRETTAEVRADHVRGLLYGKAGKLPVLPILRWHVRKIIGSYGWNYDGDDLGKVIELLGMEVPKFKDKKKRTALVLEFIDTAATGEDLVRVILAYALVDNEIGQFNTLRDQWSWSDKEGRAERWLGLLEETGYELSDADRELLAEGEKRRAEFYDRPAGNAALAAAAGEDQGDEDETDDEPDEPVVDEYPGEHSDDRYNDAEFVPEPV